MLNTDICFPPHRNAAYPSSRYTNCNFSLGQSTITGLDRICRSTLNPLMKQSLSHFLV